MEMKSKLKRSLSKLWVSTSDRVWGEDYNNFCKRPINRKRGSAANEVSSFFCLVI